MRIDLSAVERHPPIVGSVPAPGVTVAWRSEDDTADFAHRLAASAAVRNAFIELHGDLGAGKTTLVRHLLRALGVQGRIKSPTYAVMEPHVLAGGGEAAHFDFYRFADPREWLDAGFRDVFGRPGLKLSEWPDKAGPLLPTPDLRITLAPTDDGSDDARQVTVEALTAHGLGLLP